MSIHVIGAGFGRTGTLSLKAALEELGFAKCYHMVEVIQNPNHVRIWKEAMEGKAVDWNTLFQGYQATVDWPGCTFYQELMHHYPAAKVILSVRNPERWYTSTFQTIYRFSQNRTMQFIPNARHIMQMSNRLIWEHTFHGQFENQQYAIDIFNQHIATVKRTVPAKRLLVYDVKQGWEPLCQFLEVPIPIDTPFPHLNDTKSMQKMIQQRVATAQRIVVGMGAVALVGLVWGLQKLYRRTN
ncbi:MAG: sulfotransferase family protein [Chloroflexi bacterium AL-W]|nr:sulfotransferase family protein [Chloroflexi bacterium AL-N1]NOK67186.1 sulfotransferase family protein [Chloroflexi bacterium AL-N10]NOK75320.1 sulfotransferase family protein [Chloroflexi bacterium AL-N5]NOK82108.1 sulfotransferase family protein [Chloroflexi bacterium AL-W]NOK89953.1 sulfotransferase family protein [Chloroflexi bacterium AL-N15]